MTERDRVYQATEKDRAENADRIEQPPPRQQGDSDASDGD